MTHRLPQLQSAEGVCRLEVRVRGIDDLHRPLDHRLGLTREFLHLSSLLEILSFKKYFIYLKN
jgi:hypothetical protein